MGETRTWLYVALAALILLGGWYYLARGVVPASSVSMPSASAPAVDTVAPAADATAPAADTTAPAAPASN